MTALPTTAARSAALDADKRQPCTVLEIALDKCANTFGVSPCTASGSAGTECYNTFATCQAQGAYTDVVSAPAVATWGSWPVGGLRTFACIPGTQQFFMPKVATGAAMDVNLWDASTQSLVRTYVTGWTNTPNSDAVRAIGYCPLTDTLWVGGGPYTVGTRVFDVETGALLHDFTTVGAGSEFTIVYNDRTHMMHVYDSGTGDWIIDPLTYTKTANSVSVASYGAANLISEQYILFFISTNAFKLLDKSANTVIFYYTFADVTYCAFDAVNHRLLFLTKQTTNCGVFSLDLTAGTMSMSHLADIAHTTPRLAAYSDMEGLLWVAFSDGAVMVGINPDTGAVVRTETGISPPTGFGFPMSWIDPAHPLLLNAVAVDTSYAFYGIVLGEKNVNTIRFVSRGVRSPLGIALRPYLLADNAAPTNLDIEAGLATRNSVTVQLADEPDNDADLDPYYATRTSPAQGTFWTRLLARNKYYFGRQAKLRRGFVANPWNWDLFLDELYQIDQVAGPDQNGIIKITLKDALKFADLAKIPVPTSGALQADLKAIEQRDYVVSATSTTVTLSGNASPLDDYYNGMEFYISDAIGAGQRRIITDYVGASRIATLDSALLVVPDTSSTYQVGALSINIGSGAGSQYSDPVTSRKNEYIRVGSEIIRYTAKSGDVLSWTDTTQRGAFGSVVADHKANDAVQLCRAFVDQPISSVLLALLDEGGVPWYAIDTPQFTNEDSEWYGSAFHVDACISAPEQATALMAELLKQINAVMWPDPQTNLIQFNALMPSLETPPAWTEAQTIISGSLDVTSLDTLRITQAAINYAISDATANLSEAKNYLRAELGINAAAEGPNEYDDSRPDVVYSRWFAEDKQVAMRASVVRKMNRLADAPKAITLSIDPKDYTVPVAGAVDISTRRITDFTGAAKTTRCIVTSLIDKGAQIDVALRTTNYCNGRPAFIAPDGTADYPTDTVYAHAALSTGLMSDGTAGYTII